VRAMEAFLGVLMIVTVVIFVYVRFSDGRGRAAAQPRHGRPTPSHAVPPQRVLPQHGKTPGASSVPPTPSSPSSHDDAAFFDGYIWGRLEERHNERQHEQADAHDHDMFDGDDCYDDD
jgi:hypothetical protein